MKIIPFNESFVKIQTDDFGIDQELSEYFSFMVEGYKYMPAYKNGIFDGKIRLFDQRKKTIPKGLIDEVINFAKSRNYELVIDISLKNTNDYELDKISKFVDLLDLHGRGNKLEVREYQYAAIHHGINCNRSLMLSPTSSGKSLILYSIIRWHIKMERKIMVVVPSTMLVNQLFTDFQDYSSANGFDVEENFSMLYSGKERVFDKPVVITTWQSLAAMMKSDQKKFQELVDKVDVGLWDEIHTQKSKVTSDVLSKFINTKWRIGVTGTIDKTKVNKLVLTGLIGPVHKVISTKELMDAGQIVKLSIDCIVLEYPEHIRKAYKGMAYQEEINFLVGYNNRNKFISRLAINTKGNTLILQNFVERHGQVLHDMIKASTDRPVYFIHGGVETEERERIRQLLDTEKDSIVIATSSLFSTGVNVPSIENIIFAIPTKSMIRVLQSIGRGLRLKAGKTQCKLFDIADNLSYKKSINTTLTHLGERVKIYEQERFEYQLKKLPIS